MTIEHLVIIEIEKSKLLTLLVDALSDLTVASEGKRLTFRRALSLLIGITDKEAVKQANTHADKENRITVTEFRRWLPEVISQFAADVLLGKKSD